MALQITNATYDEVVATADKLVVIDFWANWCGPCRMISPIIDKLAQEYEGQVVIGKCNAEDEEDVVAKHGVRNLPTLVFLKNNTEVDRLVGGVPEAKIREIIEKHK